MSTPAVAPSAYVPVPVPVGARVISTYAINIYNDMVSIHKVAAEATPGPFLAFIEQLIASALPMLESCLTPVGGVVTADQLAAALKDLGVFKRCRWMAQIEEALITQEAIETYALPIYKASLVRFMAATAAEVSSVQGEVAALTA